MRPSILLVLFDDLRTMNSSALPLRMPRLDAIAREGTTYALAVANYPVCAPSRTMLLTGRLLPHWYEARTVEALSGKTLPHYFRESGYSTYSAGKVFDGLLGGSWTAALPFDERRTKCRDARSERRNEPVCAPLEETVDAHSSKWLSQRLRSHESGPFLAAFGLRRPHAPWEYAPRNYETKPLPPSPNFPRDAPLIAWSDNWGRVAKRRGNGGKCPTTDSELSPRLARRFRAAYAAACTTADAYLGRVLDAAERSSTNLIVAVTADHGMHLGDHGIWSKQTLFDYSLRVPLILKGPGVPRRTVIDAPVETSRLFATLTALAGLKTPPGIEPPLPPFGPHKNAARSVYTRLCKNFESERYATCRRDRDAWPRVVECAASERVWGRSLRTRSRRYTEYATSDGRLISAQLYAYAGSDLDAAASGERRNLAVGTDLAVWRARLRRAFNASSDAARRRLAARPAPGDVNAAVLAENAELRAANERLSPVAAPAPPARAEASLDDLPPLVDAARTAACDKGREGPLLISVLFFEKQSYVDGALRNLLAFTRPTTSIVVHVAAGSDTRLRNASRIVVNPERAAMCSGCGMVTRQHASNIRFAASAGVAFDHVALLASSSRLLVGGGVLVMYVARHHFSTIAERARSVHELRKHQEFAGWAGAWWSSVFNGSETHLSFAQHEGSFYPRVAALAFADWVLQDGVLGDVQAAAAVKVIPHKGQAVEELLWPTFVTNRDLGYVDKCAGSVLEAHGRQNYGPPATTDAALFARIIQLRLGRDFARCPTPVAFKKWNCGECLLHRADPGLHRTQRKRPPAKLALLGSVDPLRSVDPLARCPRACPAATALLNCLAALDSSLADASAARRAAEGRRGLADCARRAGARLNPSAALAQTPLVACGGDGPPPMERTPPFRRPGEEARHASVEKKLAVAKSLGRQARDHRRPRHPPSGPRPAQPVVMS